MHNVSFSSPNGPIYILISDNNNIVSLSSFLMQSLKKRKTKQTKIEVTPLACKSRKDVLKSPMNLTTLHQATMQQAVKNMAYCFGMTIVDKVRYI
ncbi:unnamed protein product [Arabis nemorensis]|uniref:Uncharacterized protein n=1 Tax=Arabis nemorensis TaxID=586526 RepID=A0A565BTX8_9BRAS|nr:unnamed protein product [Arabis nemorensis]